MKILGCREASRKASLMTNSTVLDDTREPLKLPAFEKAVLFAVTQALETWRDEAMEGVLTRTCTLKMCRIHLAM